ncbi:type III secretion system translocon protein [Vibrio pectenicida]|uniref:Type III secretion system translocon protein n=1 Tax=Vibrio pectenicida TaxID=62763 RepID=A0A7Y3ZYR5_9VIBR|nr:type III secretion system translocon protein [Vibrio pectenicida]NOH71597.1 type III secretion system translocon protein [Vibrio pectenicida]
MTSINFNTQTAVSRTSDTDYLDNVQGSKARLPLSGSSDGLVDVIAPESKSGVVNSEAASQALQRVLLAFHQDDSATVSQLEKASMTDMVLMSANLGLKTFGDTANAAAKAARLMTDTQAVLRDQQVKEFQEQLSKRIEQSDKAQKGGIFAAIFDWIVGAVEAVIGVFKLIEGAARVAVGDVVGGAMDMASGAAYLTAGIAGMVKAAAETAILCGADKEKCQQVIDVASKVQLGAEVVAMTLDIFQAGRAISATRSIAKGTETAMQEAAPKLVESIAKGSTQEVTNIAQQVGKQVSEQVAEQVSKQLMSGVTKGVEQVAERGGQIAKSLTKAFSEEAIQQLVTKSVEKAATAAIEKGVQVTAQEITKQVTTAVRNEVIKTIIKACTYTSLDLIRASAGSGKAITSGIVTEEKAKLQKQIEDLILKQNLMEFCYDWYDKAKEQQSKTIKDLVDKQGDSLDGANKVINESGMLQARIATSAV